MSYLEKTWIYKRAGLTGLRLFFYIWFSLLYLVFGVVVFFSFFLPRNECVACISLSLLGVALLTKMFVSFRVDLKSFEDEISNRLN